MPGGKACFTFLLACRDAVIMREAMLNFVTFPDIVQQLWVPKGVRYLHYK